MLGSIIAIIVVIVVATTTVTYTVSLTLGNSSAASSTTAFSSPIAVSSAAAALVWGSSTSYPTEIWAQSCVQSGGYDYCVGGTTGPSTGTITSAVYFTSLSPTGVGTWPTTTSYPEDIRSESCVSTSSMIYCVGGVNSTAVTYDVFYAPLSASGVGEWNSTTPYPTPVWTQSCAANDLGVYCVGGDTPALEGSGAVIFAPFSSSGLGPWTVTSSYPVGVSQESCEVTNSDIYCIGGVDKTAVYYAPVTSSGVGHWSSTTGYPFTVGANLLSCVTIAASIYCVGGHTGPNVSNAVYHAPLSESGVGQ